MADQWYFAWNDNKFGPFTAAELRALGKVGRLQPTDTVWKAGTEKGVVANKIKGLFPNAPAQVEALPLSTEGQAGQQARDGIPDGLMLRAELGENDLAPLPTPWTKSPKLVAPLLRRP